MPVAGTLLRLSDGRPDTGELSRVGGSPCTYVVVNRAAASPALLAYLQQLPLERIGSDPERDLYRVSFRR
jgi:hypothetical protein